MLPKRARLALWQHPNGTIFGVARRPPPSSGLPQPWIKGGCQKEPGQYGTHRTGGDHPIPGHGAGLGQTQGPHPARETGPPPPQAPGFRRVPADAPCDGPSNPLCPVFEPYGSWSRPVHDAGRRHPAPHPGPSIWRSPPLPGRGSVRCRTRELFVSQGHGSRPSAGTRVPGKRRIPVFCNGPSRASWVRTDGHRTGPASRVADQQVARTHGGQVQSADCHPQC